MKATKSRTSVRLREAVMFDLVGSHIRETLQTNQVFSKPELETASIGHCSLHFN